MLRATELAQRILQPQLAPGDWVIDATVGNGHDTVWLAQRVGATGRVFGFDVQDAALEATAALTLELPQVTLIRRGHEQLAEYLPADAKHKITAVMFNLGYLPGTNKHLTTQPTTTLLALTQALEYLCVGGLTTVVTYPGHAGGKDEATAVQSYVNGLTSAYTVTCCARTNAATPAPELIVIERVR
jgi:predicted methyltransferase